MEILSAKDITFSYAGSSQQVLKDINFTINKGDFIVLCGPSGSGKSTLLRLLKKEVAPHGKFYGDSTFCYEGKIMAEHDQLKLVKEIGMIFQDPENQIVMDNVWDELLFGMENLGFPTETMRKKVAEMVHYFGLTSLIDKKTHELSGGQKQIINLSSVLLLDPKILLLDEPTAQLDPIAAKEFIQFLKQLNDEFGITIIIVEHRLEELFTLANRVMVMKDGELVQDTIPREAVLNMYREMRHYLPSTALLYLDSSTTINQEALPLSVKEAKEWVASKQQMVTQQVEPPLPQSPPLFELANVDYQYSKDSQAVLNNLSISVNQGECMALVGANGTGKTTLLKVIGGVLKPQHGTIKFGGKKVKHIDNRSIGYLPQNPKIFFLHDTLVEEYKHILQKSKKKEKEMEYLVEKFQLTHLLNRHPYDLSGGELQKAAIVGILLDNPSLLLIDEPTKGMDPEFKIEFGELIQGLVKEGLTIIMVTHDIEFAASYANRCGMLFNGNITVTENTREFFQKNTYYTTVINRVLRESQVPAPVTLEEALPLFQS